MKSSLHHLLQEQIAAPRSPEGDLDIEALFARISTAYARVEPSTEDAACACPPGACDTDAGTTPPCGVLARNAGFQRDSQRLAATLANLDQGVILIDGDGRIVISNSKFAEFTGLVPADYENQPLFTDIVEKMLAQGEFDPMGKQFKLWVRNQGHHPRLASFQRVRPDGTVLQVRVSPLADGGEVRTMTDITSHIRHSDEISAIRRTLELTLENVSQGIMKIDPDRRIVVTNSRLNALLGLPEGFFDGGRLLEDLLDYQVEHGEFTRMAPGFADFIRNGGLIASSAVYEWKRPNGTILEIRTVPLPDGSAVRTYTDITEIRTREHALEKAREEYHSLFENSIVGIYRSTLDGRQIRANPALVRLNGYDSEEEMIARVNDIGQQWYVDPGRRQEFVDIMERDGRTSDFVSEVYRHNTREKIWVSEAAWVVRDEDGKPLYYEGMVIDATARKRAENEIAHLALHDMLTNLPNRTLFHDTLATALTDNRRGHEIAVLCLDLDHFKDVNDTMGHDCGDILLRMASRRLARAIPPGGMAARFGGDEFAVLLPDIRDREVVIQLSRHIVESLSRPYRIRGHRVYVGASIGISLAPGDGNDAHDLLKKADIALYRAKRDGRGTYACFDEGMTAALLMRRDIEIDLRRAIANDEFRLFYQPIMDLETGRPNGYEALIRWQHPQKGLLSPAYFIEIAEQSGLIMQIGELVLKQACHCLAQNDSRASVSVNLSPVQFRNHQLALSVVNALAQSGLSPSRLILEITESVLLTDDTRTLDILRQLRALGVRIALDDFGVGHSSLSYLQKFSFDRIKIDKSFVQHAEDGMMNTAIRRAILGLGNDLGIEIVVEGVETEEQRDMLLYEGCRLIQGYLYGRPKPAEEIFSPGVAAPDAHLRIAG